MKIEWTELALDRVAEIARYIALDSVSDAERWVDKLFDYVGRLETFPESGRHLPELASRPEIRELLAGNYRIIYKVTPKTVYILTIRHSKQILPTDAF